MAQVLASDTLSFFIKDGNRPLSTRNRLYENLAAVLLALRQENLLLISDSDLLLFVVLRDSDALTRDHVRAHVLLASKTEQVGLNIDILSQSRV